MSATLRIESLDHEGRGIARQNGKVIFVEGALPGETVLANIYRKKPAYEQAQTLHIIRPSYLRVDPPCPNYGRCGGCAMQHLDPAGQVAAKQRTLEDNFRHLAKLNIPQVLPPLHGQTWGYRYRARLSVRYVRKKDAVLVGFRERRGQYVVDMHECLVLPPHVSALITPLRTLIATLSIREHIPQIEVAVGDDCTVLALRHMAPLSSADQQALNDFAEQYRIVWWLQPKGLDTLAPMHIQDANRLAYHLPQFGLRMSYQPSDFTQVNYGINRSMIAKALSLLALAPHHRVADLFCGLGNFTLPLATQVASVVGIEGSATLTQRALEAAHAHGLAAKTQFATLNLFEVDVQWLRDLGHFDRMLIDPPREGAFAVAKALAALNDAERPARIVYVSCNPATLARDAAVLVHEGGYRLRSAGVINMFPHTAHVESIALFEWRRGDPIPEGAPLPTQDSTPETLCD